MNSRTSFPMAMVVALALAATASAQTLRPDTTPAPPWVAPAVGSIAPDFALTGATQYGVLRAPVRLSDYRGNTVVLAFFYKARTKG
jgi:peroxiredoxin Q/BCP